MFFNILSATSVVPCGIRREEEKKRSREVEMEDRRREGEERWRRRDSGCSEGQ